MSNKTNFCFHFKQNSMLSNLKPPVQGRKPCRLPQSERNLAAALKTNTKATAFNARHLVRGSAASLTRVFLDSCQRASPRCQDKCKIITCAMSALFIPSCSEINVRCVSAWLRHTAGVWKRRFAALLQPSSHIKESCKLSTNVFHLITHNPSVSGTLRISVMWVGCDGNMPHYYKTNEKKSCVVSLK